MPKCIVLDSAPLGLLASPARTSVPSAIAQWVKACDAAGHYIVIPEIVDYEIRRELLRLNRSASVTELDRLKSVLTFCPITSDAILLAADLWAQTRRRGKPTAADQNIDVDVILVAQVLTLGVPTADLIVATANTRHIRVFVAADEWSNIAP